MNYLGIVLPMPRHLERMGKTNRGGFSGSEETRPRKANFLRFFDRGDKSMENHFCPVNRKNF
jgi:hypothetical protein